MAPVSEQILYKGGEIRDQQEEQEGIYQADHQHIHSVMGSSAGVPLNFGLRLSNPWGPPQSASLKGYLDWPGLVQVCCVGRRERRKDTETVERVFATISLSPERRTLLVCWRSGVGTGGLRIVCTG